MDYVVTAQGLSKRYRQFWALQGLDMQLPKGAIYGLVGKNGAGKTTLIRLLCGLQTPTEGWYTLYGAPHDRPGILAARRRVGAVVETPSICLDLSAKDNLLYQYRNLGLPVDEGAGELLELVGLARTGAKKARHFSLGMKQRLGIAVAMAGGPDLLILDEPANGLDPQGIVEMRELILTLNRERGVTVLISSHILDELARLATHYGFIDDGRMVRQMSAEELEAACRKCLRVRVSDVHALARVLSEGLPEVGPVEHRILSEHEADLYGTVSLSRLAAALSAAGCELEHAAERDETLESFFLSLIGGGRDE